MIYVLCPDIAAPTGGIKVLYRHVDVLRDLGYESCIMHGTVGFRATWFKNNTPVVHAQSAALAPDDWLVVPEIWGPRIATDFAPGNPKVIYNQSGSLTFQGYPADGSGVLTPYHSQDLRAVFVISEAVEEYVRYAFPRARTCRMQWSLDGRLFKPPSPERKRRQIAFMPRRRGEEAQQVFNLLRFRGALDEFQVVPIEGLDAAGVASVLQDSTFFFAFGYPEGLPLPPAEAMACGCVVVGYHGWGGEEYFLPEFCYPVQAGDVLAFARTAEVALSELRNDTAAVLQKGAAAAAYISSRYSEEQERRLIAQAWESLLSGED